MFVNPCYFVDLVYFLKIKSGLNLKKTSTYGGHTLYGYQVIVVGRFFCIKSSSVSMMKIETIVNYRIDDTLVLCFVYMHVYYC